MQNPKEACEEFRLSAAQASILAVECWRLGRVAEEEELAAIVAGVKRSVRVLNDVVESLGLQALDFTGRKYDSGMAPEVVEVLDGASAAAKDTVIHDTIAPTLLHRGQVISPGQIVLQRIAAPPAITPVTNE